MKKILFGITLILFSIVLYLFSEEGFAMFYNDIVTGIYIILPFVGMAFAIWGLVEKEDNK